MPSGDELMKELFGDSPLEFNTESNDEIIFGESLSKHQDILDSIQTYVGEQKYSQKTIEDYENVAKAKGLNLQFIKIETAINDKFKDQIRFNQKEYDEKLEKE